MLTWGLDRSKTAYPRRKFSTGEADWRCSDINGLVDLADVRAVRKNGASVRKDDMVEGKKETTTQTQGEELKWAQSGKKSQLTARRRGSLMRP